MAGVFCDSPSALFVTFCVDLLKCSDRHFNLLGMFALTFREGSFLYRKVPFHSQWNMRFTLLE